MWVPSLALLRVLRIQHWHELRCRSQKRLGTHVTMAVVWAGSYSSDSTPHLGTSICCMFGPKIKKKLRIQGKREQISELLERDAVSASKTQPNTQSWSEL